MTAGWISAFKLTTVSFASQGYWIVPALLIGVGVGFGLRSVKARKTALILALTAAVGLAGLNHFSPGSRISFSSVSDLFSGSYSQTRQLQIAKRFQTAPFDKPFSLVSPLPLNLSLMTRFPAGVDDFCFAPDGSLYASLPELGAVYRIKSSTGEADAPELFLHGLDNPTGLVCAPDQLILAETEGIRTFDYAGTFQKVLVKGLPADGGHQGHRLQPVPEGLLFSIGSRCDACSEPNPLRGTLQLLRLNGRQELYARGLRQTGGLTYVASEKSLWGTERSRRWPEPGGADELNLLQQGSDYGWPHCEGALPEKILGGQCLDAHQAEAFLLSRANPAGLIATTSLKFPMVYRNSLLIVLQGDPAYRIASAIVRIPRSAGGVGGPVAFLGGWDGKRARPSALHVGPDAALYIADEVNGAIYRAAYRDRDE